MPDISMCLSENCTKSTTCYRHPDSGTKPCEQWQTWFGPEPEGCAYYWEMKR